MYLEIREKAIKLAQDLESMTGVDEKKKLKIIKQLNKSISETDPKIIDELPDVMLGFSRFQELGNNFLRANSFFIQGGKESFDSLVMSTPKSKLVKLFKKFEKTFSDEEYWDNLGYVYTIQDYEYNDYDLYKELFSSTRACKDKLMSPEDFNFFTSLPDQITIYRGGGIREPEKGYGISWTLNIEIAEKFVRIKKHLSAEQMVVHKLVIQKSKATAYLNNRKEEEIIYIND